MDGETTQDVAGFESWQRKLLRAFPLGCTVVGEGWDHGVDVVYGYQPSWPPHQQPVLMVRAPMGTRLPLRVDRARRME